ncbi:MAG: DUF1492 domain-containing protein [Oscillospiraceae bacterium]|nr:DUF1492 domain-containing protein [Oscillospiraceae bacterium]MBR1530406.1 DUF1492 domain-containing protein [Oscillospiraceae bacterium]
MTDDRAKKIEWLKRAKHADILATAFAESYERDREIARKLTRVISDMPRSNKNENSTETALIKFTETSIQAQQKLCDLHKTRNEITRAIQSIDNADMQAVLTLRYLCYMTIDQTAEAMCYDKATVWRKHNAALDKLEIP